MYQANKDFTNFEITIANERDTVSLELLRTKILECLLNIKGIKFQKNINPFSNNLLLTGIAEQRRIMLKESERLEIIKYLDKFHYNDFYITCDKEKIRYITNLFKNIESQIDNLRKKVFFCKGDKIDKKKRIFIIDFLNNFDKDIYFYENSEEILYSLHLHPISTPKVDFNKSFHTLISNIMVKDYKSNFFSISSKLDRENIKRLKNSELLVYPYYNNSIKSKYIMINSLLQVNIKNNLSTCNPKNILKNLENFNFIETLNFISSQEIMKFRPLVNFNYQIFEDIEEAVCFNIYLGSNGVDGLMIKEKKIYIICYENEKIEIPSDFDKETFRHAIIYQLKKQTNIEIDYEKYKIHELVNAYNHYGVLIFEDHKTKFNPVNKLHLPLEYFQNKGLGMYNLEKDVSGFLKGISKKKVYFNRSSIKIIEPVEFNLIEKIKNYYTLLINFKDENIVLKFEVYINDDKNWDNLLQKLWKKGYFLSEYGLQRYIDSGIIESKDIKSPDWFELENSEDLKWICSFIATI